MKRWLTWILTLALLACGAAAVAEADAGWAFANEAVEAAARQALERPEGPITAAELAEIEEIWLDVAESGDLDALGDFAALTGLRLLNIDIECHADLTPLTALTGPQSLWLYAREDHDIDLAPVSRMTWLRDLTVMLRRDYAPEDLEPLAKLTDLRRLYVCEPFFDMMGGGTIEALPSLAGMTALEELELTGFTLPDLSGIAGMTGLRRLTVNNCYIDDLSALSTLTGLEELNLPYASCEYWDLGEVGDLSLLAGLPRLRKLNLLCQNVQDLSQLAALPALEELELGYIPKVDLTPLQALDGLKALGFSGHGGTDLTPLGGMKRLEALSLSTNHGADLSFLGEMTGLRRLTLEDISQLDLNWLAGAENLEELTIDYSSFATDLTPLTALKRLKKVTIKNSGTPDLAPLEAIEGLEIG